ncbi:DUF445 domain-containing protein [Bacillus sp. ISL-47]|uniref:DUF445 domain-containing protein n=1 Tax=Bacillus sp. ISL-47 TaxID=2819130 RepID=UPI001BE5771A|nr:DUF445 family protein [Bacillus sp. ISL-47]MBT2691107.1 DUF445 domain-containing protein [Bacillus sp. ISL-47]MBT2711014.1 DUF445 domain-containing protein [Pseudomonas sp. ISL-84]
MQIAITIIIMIIIGAIIGGFTNSLAIKMLFRPYKPLYIKNWRVPFTPGLIPKRRDELAAQMGKMVTDHLLTPESIQRKFLNEGFQKDMTGLVQKELENLLNTDKTPAELLVVLGIEDAHQKAEDKLNQFVEEKYENLMVKYRTKPLRAVVSPEIIQKVDAKLPIISSYILEKGVDYFSSIEGKMRIQRMADDFVRERSGMLSNMLQMFMGNINLADKIQPEIVRFLKNEGTADLITTILKKEWNKVLDWEAERIEEQFEKEKLVNMIKGFVQKVVKLDVIFKTPLSQLTVSYRTKVIEEVAPKSVELLGGWLSRRIDVLMERLHLAEIVRQQVETFSVERLEEMVLSITKSELKMITYLGALLGGVIGLFQGILVIFIN